jgi:hypothetical protein
MKVRDAIAVFLDSLQRLEGLADTRIAFAH